MSKPILHARLHEIIQQEATNQHKLKDLRTHFELVIKDALDYDKDDKVECAKLLYALSKSPGYFGRQLSIGQSILKHLNKVVHTDELHVTDNDFRNFLVNKYFPFLGRLWDGDPDSKVSIPDPGLVKPLDKNYLERTRTRFYVDEKIYLELKESQATYVLHVAPTTGKHPKGTYKIPNNVAITFIETKRNGKGINWIKNQNFHQDGVPRDLEDYFDST